MSESDDYKRGWYDGYNAKNKSQTYPTDLPGFGGYTRHVPSPTTSGVTCSKCSKVYLPYSCCPQAECPMQPYMRSSYEQG